MVDEKALPFIIRTKLHRPPVHGVHIHRQRLFDQLDEHRERPLTLISAPAGYGKTTLASCWLEISNSASAWVSLDENDNDLSLFLSYFLAAIQTIFPNFGRETLALTNAETLAPMSILVSSLINEIDSIEQSFILALDDFQLIKNKSVLDLVNQLLRHPASSMHLILISRRDPFLPISTLRAKRLMTEIRAQDLRFNEMETAMFLTQQLGMQVDASAAEALEQKTEGWVTGLLLATISMRNEGILKQALLEQKVDIHYIMNYLFTEVFSHQPSEISHYLINTAILDRFCGPLCEAVCAPVGEPPTRQVSGWEFIAWLKEQNLFVIPLDNENRWFRFHHLFQKLLLNQTKRHFKQGGINALHDRASKWFAENGRIEEAIKHALAGGDSRAAVQLIAKHGFDLLNGQQWPRLKRWLRMVPGEMADQEPELLIFTCWLHMTYSRFSDFVPHLDKAEALCTTRTTKEHIIGHLNALRSFKHVATANGERTLICAKRAFEKIPRQHEYARRFTFITEAIGHQILGDRAKTRATIKKAMGEVNRSGSSSQGYFQVFPCYIYWMDADLRAILQTSARSLNLGKNNQEYQAIAHSLYFSGIAHYDLNELKAAEEELVAVVKEPHLQHAFTFAHSAFALALVHQARGRTDAANQVAESVVSYCLDTNNLDLLNIAWAFEAELAFRQGRTAEAYDWAEKFAPKPFFLMYRFYVPQLTLVKVLLSQDTADSRDQATELLKQLHDFVVSCHNKRFQIDVLALQALLYDSQGERKAAFESLTNAIQLAEPHCFIRPFVDLGPSMADQLKKLHRKNIARKYIEKILAAFEQEGEQTVLPEANGRPAAPARQPREPSPLSPPLVEPMTNRELDVLELLAHRLSNKEIADKLFISAETVKGHLRNIYQKLEVKKRRKAVEKAKKIGIL
jgi:LuxR family maltose regulon positive regulatory protein